MNTKNIFTFFKNGQTVNSIKNEAKKLQKSGKFSTRSSALNSLSKEICGLSFNKAVKIAELASPFELNNRVYFPFFNEGNKMNVVMKKDHVCITGDFVVNFPDECSLGVVSFKSFEKTTSGWIFEIYSNVKSCPTLILGESDQRFGTKDYSIRYFFEIKESDDGILVDLWCEEETGEGVELISLGSNFAYWNEIFEETDDFEKLDFEGGNAISDMHAAIQLNHTTIDQRSELARYKNMVLSLVGAVQILTPDGEYLCGKRVFSIVDDGVCSKKELISWLDNNVDIDSLSEYECVHNPWFDICYEDGEPLNECFSSIKKEIMSEFEYIDYKGNDVK